MTLTPTATFVVEPQPVHGYRITAAAGPAAARLRRSALAVLGLLGQPSPSGPEQVHAWLGPAGPQGEFVRVAIERLPGGEFRYQQAWFPDKALPPHPARLNFPPGSPDRPEPSEWPADLVRILDCARRSADSGGTEWISLPPAVDALVYCRALTEVLGTPPGNRLTWITHAPAAPVPVHLQFRSDAGLHPIACVGHPPTGEQRLRNVVPVAMPKSGAKHHGSGNGSRPRRWGLLLGLLIVFLGGGAAGWFGREGLAASLPALLGSSSDAIPGLSIKPAPRQPDPRETQLRSTLNTARGVREKLRDHLSREGIAAPANVEQVDEKDSVQLVFLTVAKVPVSLKNTEIKQLLECLRAIEEWQKPDSNPSAPATHP
jgi:hypothetical protein